MSFTSTTHHPECLAIIVCNEVIEDKRTNNKSLIGLFNGIMVGTVPATHHRMFIFVSLTDGRGEQSIILRIEAPSGQKVFEVVGTMKFPDPLSVHDLAIEVLGLPLPEIGEYYIGVYCGAERLGSRRFNVIQRQEA
jgi:hypothetical protein